MTSPAAVTSPAALGDGIGARAGDSILSAIVGAERAFRGSREDPGQCNPPSQERRRQRSGKLRRVMWRLRRVSRERSPCRRHQGCGWKRVSSHVELCRRVADGKAYLFGVQKCGQVWGCPVCRMTLLVQRAGEVAKVVEEHGHNRAVLASFTIRHRAGERLGELVKGLANAYRRLTRGAPWKRFCEALGGLSGYVRGLETTHGANGWHPHLHVIFLLRDELPEEWDRKLAALEARLFERWRACVVRELGVEHAPESEHGVDLRPCHQADYIAKLGLELADPGTKQGKRGSRTPLQILDDVRVTGDEGDGALWDEYAHDMKGHRQLTWSRGLRARFLDEAQIDEPTEHDLVALIDAQSWNFIRKHDAVQLGLLDLVEGGATEEQAWAYLEAQLALLRENEHGNTS